MARDYLGILSPTWNKKTAKTRRKKQLLVGCLTDTYDLPDGGANEIIELLRREGHGAHLSRSAVYLDRDMYQLPYRYLHRDEEVRRRVAEHTGNNHGPLLGIVCLLTDHPKLETWEQVEEMLAAIAPAPPAAPNPVAVVPEDSAESSPVAGNISADNGLEELFPPPSALDEKFGNAIAALERFREHVRAIFVAVHKENRRLATENTFLHKRLGEYTRAHRAAEEAATTTETAVSDLATMCSIEAFGLPTKTAMSGTKGGWAKEFDVVYGDPFRTRLTDGYLELWERNQVVKALGIFAQQGRFHTSLGTEKYNRPLPGVPGEIRSFSCSRASIELRFSWKQNAEGVITVFNVHHHNEIDTQHAPSR